MALLSKVQSAALLTEPHVQRNAHVSGCILTCGDSPFPMAGFMGLAGPPGLTKLSE